MTESSFDLRAGALVVLIALPVVAALGLGVLRWATGRRVPEAILSRTVRIAFSLATLLSLSLLASLFILGEPPFEADLGVWFEVGHYRFRWLLVGDRLSLLFAGFSSGLVWIIAAFSSRYLHREPGFHRFYLMLTLFGSGVLLVVLAGNLDLVFFGWEVVGLTSALLIAFFHERRLPVENGLRAFVTYRFCDIGLLSAAVWLHHTIGHSHLSTTPGAEAWAVLPVPPGAGDVVLVGFLVLWASMGKAAQIPLGGWLPRAMEGPTPSSAIFYGAISVHLGPYLLLRATPILEADARIRAAVILVGALTALHATFVGRVQSDIKSVLAYASMTQLGLIYVEIGLGFHGLALVHIVGHASLRSLQILRSPSLLHDHQHMEQAMGGALPRSGGHLERWVPAALQPWLYRAALERGYLDTLIVDQGVARLMRGLRWLDALDAAWSRRLAREVEGSDESTAIEGGRR